MYKKTWDPLESGRRVEKEIVVAAQKRQLKNIINSYVGMYDSFSELIQNAMDATDRRKVEINEKDYQGKIWITIDLSENSFSITDNGIGFDEDQFKSFLAPNISFKEEGTTRGNKGVGATYIGYGFDYLQFGTKGNSHENACELIGGRTWVEDNANVIPNPVVKQSKINDPEYKKLDRGSTFKIKFGGKNTRPKDLSWYSAKTPQQWLYLLLIKTPLGSIDYIEGKNSLIIFELSVIDKKGKKNTLEDQEAKYMFPHIKINASVNLKDVIVAQEKLTDKGEPASAIPSKFTKSNGMFEFFRTEDILDFRSTDNDFQEIVNEYGIEAYGYFSYSTSIWDQFNDKLAKLRKGFRVLKGGIQLSNNNMIQGELVTIPLKANIGYQNQCHIIVHFRNADPDLGRKGFQPELKNTAEKVAVSIVNKFKRWKNKLLKTDTGEKHDITKEIELHEWIKKQEQHEDEHPLEILNKNFFIPINSISITSEPQSEQDVVVLFNQLIAGGVIRGFKLLATSQIKQYDGVYRFVVKEPIKNHIYDKELNPLGVEELRHSGEFEGPPKILEYKKNLDALIREFDNEEKNEKEVHLAVTWEMGSEWRKNYDITSYLDLDNLHLRDYHGLTHVLDSGTTKFYAIVLKELIDYLNAIEKVQEYQKEEYGDDLF